MDVRRFGFQSWDDGTRLYRASRGPAILPHPLLHLEPCRCWWCWCKPTQPNGLSLLRLHLRVSTNRPPPSPPTPASSSTSSYFSSSDSFTTLSLPPTATYRRTLPLPSPPPPPPLPSPTHPPTAFSSSCLRPSALKPPRVTTFSTSADTLTRTRNFVPSAILPLPCPSCDPLLPICPSAAPQPRAIPKNLNVSPRRGRRYRFQLFGNSAFTVIPLSPTRPEIRFK